MKTGADEPAVRTALAAMCWHSSGGSAADTLRIRSAGIVDVRSLRTARRLEAPGWLAQLYAGAVVYMDEGWKDHTNVCVVAVGGGRVDESGPMITMRKRFA